MSIFSNMNNILVQESSANNVINIENIHSNTDNENYSFMNESYAFILEYTKDYNNSVKEFYKNILESGDNQEIITESFGDFFTKAKEIIKKFLEFIKKIFSKFVAKLHSIFKSEKYLEKNKNEFSKFISDDEFTIKGYNFTNILNSNIPVSNIDVWFDGDLQSSDITTGESDNILTAVTSKYDALVNKLEDWYDKFRGQVIGVDYEISSSDYDEELRKIFRDDSDSKTDITVDSTMVSKAYQDFHNYEDLIKSIENTKKEIETNYNKLEKALETSYKKEKNGDGIFFKFNTDSIVNTWAKNQAGKFSGEAVSKDTTNEVYNKIDMFMKAKVSQVQQMSSIHTIAFSAKLQAAKDCFVQNKTILYKALIKIKGHKSV